MFGIWCVGGHTLERDIQLVALVGGKHLHDASINFKFDLTSAELFMRWTSYNVCNWLSSEVNWTLDNQCQVYKTLWNESSYVNVWVKPKRINFLIANSVSWLVISKFQAKFTSAVRKTRCFTQSKSVTQINLIQTYWTFFHICWTKINKDHVAWAMSKPSSL